ncbi:YlaF family protein [Bacillus spongiae]|uniref:YlaF family protein n=1 Tax=Bacillus spongiae TaxID=2683610 RepID=A0ABU8HA45_9BACI
MSKIQWPFVFFAILAASAIIGIGIFISERSLIGILLCIVALITIMGVGFTTKKKIREK